MLSAKIDLFELFSENFGSQSFEISLLPGLESNRGKQKRMTPENHPLLVAKGGFEPPTFGL